MRRKYVWLAAALLILMGIFTAWQAQGEKTYQIENMTGVTFKNGMMYGIDFTGESYNVLRSGMDGAAELVKVPMAGRDGRKELSDIVVADDGEVYVYASCQKGNSEEAAVCRVDFERHELEKQWIIPEDIRREFWFLSMADGNRPVAVADRGILMTWYGLVEGGEIEFLNSYILPDFSLTLDVSDPERMWFYDQFGNLYNYDHSGSLQLLFSNDGTQVGADNTDFRLIGETVRFYNITEDSWYGIDFDDAGGEIEKLYGARRVLPESFDVRRMGTLEYLEDEDLYAGILPLEEGRQVPAVFGRRERVYDTLVLDGAWVWRSFAKKLVFRSAALTVLFLAVWYLVLRRKRFPLWERVLLVAVPVTALGYWGISGQIDRRMEAVIMERHLELMYSYGEIQVRSLDEIRYEKMRQKDFLEPGDEKNLFQFGPHRFAGKYYMGAQETEGPEETFDVSLYYVKGDQIYNAVGANRYNIPAEYVIPARIYEAMETAVRTKGPSYLEYNDELGRWYSVFVPVKDEAGGLTGLLQVQSPMEREVAEGMADSAKVHRSLLWLSSGMMAAAILILLINMSDLRVLLKAVERVAGGDRTVRVKVRGRSEAAAAGRAFNHMLDELDENLRGLEAFNEKYRAFVPGGLFRLMGHKGADDIGLGDEKEIHASVLSVSQGQLTERYLEHFLEVVRGYGGVAGHISETEMDNVFSECPEYALRAAVSILQKEKDPKLHIGLAYGGIRLGIVGGDSRREVKMISGSLQLARFLAKRAEYYGASALTSGTFMDQTGEAGERYHRRLLGFVLMKSEDRLEPVWEVLDGEPQESFLLKERTKAVFEKGVELFMIRQFAAARREFIRVLDENRQDAAASRYSFLCQRYMEEQGKTEIKGTVCLEEF